MIPYIRLEFSDDGLSLAYPEEAIALTDICGIVELSPLIDTLNFAVES